MDSKTGIKEEVSSPGSKPFPEGESEKSKKNNSEDLADQMFLEAQDLILHSPWITNIEIQGGEKEKRVRT